MVDVIVPVYNGLEYFDALFSGIEKTRVPYRLIIVNDKSPDPETGKYLEKYAAEHDNVVPVSYTHLVQVISIADREKTEMEEGMLPLSTRNVYPSCLLPQVEEEALGILQEYIRHTGQKDGALSMQFFWKTGKRCV